MNRFVTLRFGIQAKITVLIALFILLTSAALSWYFIHQERKLQIAGLVKLGRALTKELAKQSEEAIVTADTDALLDLVNDVSQEQDLVYAIVHDTQGTILAQVGAISPAAILEQLETEVETSQGPAEPVARLFMTATTGESLYDVAAPILRKRLVRPIPLEGSVTARHPAARQKSRWETVEERAGVARVGLSLARINTVIRERERASIFLTSVVVGLGIVGTLLVTHFIVKPLRQLAVATKHMGQGNLQLRVDVRSRDEVGDLTQEFNTMATRLHEAYAGLEHKVAERTQELERASQHKSQFLANMSHELRTPLNAIIGYTEMLYEEAADLGQEGFLSDLHKIQVAGTHLLALINDILDLSKIEAGRMDLFLEIFDVTSVVQDIVITIQPLVEQNDNTLTCHMDSALGTMWNDMTKTRQSLLNLLSNACKFTKQGTITLTVRRELVDGRAWLTFQVSDTGIGMTPEQMGKLFQAFSQVDASTTREYGGTGLGLAISQRFCQSMGGDIIVESALGQGATFTMWLPTEVVGPQDTPVSRAEVSGVE